MTKTLIMDSDFYQIESYFDDIKSKSYLINKLLKRLGDTGTIFVVGGTIRDLVIKKKSPRDIDLIIDTNEDLGRILCDYQHVILNRFGGYKITIDNLEFDIWRMNEHWAFREKLLEQKQNNLKYSTFLNFDSIFYNFKSKKFDSDIFNNCLNNKLLEITIDEDRYIRNNPTKEINIIRMMNIVNEWDLKLGDNCSMYISKWMEENNNSVEKLYQSQFKHYKEETVSIKYIKEFIKVLNIN